MHNSPVVSRLCTMLDNMVMPLSSLVQQILVLHSDQALSYCHPFSSPKTLDKSRGNWNVL